MASTRLEMPSVLVYMKLDAFGFLPYLLNRASQQFRLEDEELSLPDR